MLQRAPFYLRVVIGPRGKVDALDQLEDEPGPRETIHVYYRVSEPIFACVRRGCYLLADYRHAAGVNGERFRDSDAWRTWAESDPLQLTPREVAAAT